MQPDVRYNIRRETIATERMLADVRLVLWLATVLTTSWLRDEGVKPWLMPCLVVFLGYSLFMWATVRYFPKLLRTSMVISSFIEVCLITVIISATSGIDSPFSLWYVFYVVSVSLRYGMQISLLGLAASVVLYTAASMPPISQYVYVPGFLGLTGFLFVLAFMFGHMSERQRSYQTRLTVVNELGVALSSVSTSREIINLLISQTATILNAHRCWFAQSNDETASNAIGVNIDDIHFLLDNLADWSPLKVLEKRKVLISNRPKRDSRLPSSIIKRFKIKSLAAVPMYVRDVPVGVLYVADKEPRGFYGYDVDLLDLIAAQAAPIIENVQLWERLKDAAASEERLRIARDLHDNFLQTLSAIKLYLERCRLLIDKNPDKAKASVERLHEISTEGLADVRSYLSQLRLMGPEPSRFRQAVERSAVEAAARGGFAVDTYLEISEDVLTPQISLAAFQILRELLNNVVKHANASNVSIIGKSSSDSIEIEVVDDGVGFDLEEGLKAREKGHLGLVGIKERVAELSGTFHVTTSPANGTRAQISLPISVGNK